MAMTAYPDDPKQRLRQRIGSQVAGQVPAPIGAPPSWGSGPLPSAPFDASAPTRGAGLAAPAMRNIIQADNPEGGAGGDVPPGGTIGELPGATPIGGDVPNPFPDGGGTISNPPPYPGGQATPFPEPGTGTSTGPNPFPTGGGTIANPPPLGTGGTATPLPLPLPGTATGTIPNPFPTIGATPGATLPTDTGPGGWGTPGTNIGAQPGATPPGTGRADATPPGTGGSLNSPNSPWLTGDPVRDPVRQFVIDVLSKNGKQPTGRGSGPTDLEYYVDRILAEGGLNSGYDWAGRIQRGINGTQPAEGAGTGGTKAAPKAGVWTDAMQQLRDLIMGRLAQANSPIDVNAPNITEPTTAARNEATRSSEQERAALAERLYAQGGGALDTNAINQNIQQSAERNAASVGRVRAMAIMQEVQAKRQELQQLLQLALSAGDSEAARNVQLSMADLEATLRREGWGIDLAKFQAQLDQQAALAGLNG